MKNKGVRFVALLLLFTFVFSVGLTGCGKEEIYLSSKIEKMYAGETKFISVKTGKDQFATKLLYVSANPEVATVTDYGVILAAQPGKTTIYVQSKENPKWRLEFDLKVEYGLEEQLATSQTATNEKYAADEYDFWTEHGYSKRENKILDIAMIVATKKAQEYVFTELEDCGSVQQAMIYQFSDWGNEDVFLHFEGIDAMTVSRLFAEQFQIKAGLINQESLEDIAKQINQKISAEIRTLQYKVHLSKLSNKYEYRILVPVNCSLVKTDNYYSLGLLAGVSSVIKDFDKLSVDSFLDLYTYRKSQYELVDFNINGIVIERRPK